MLKILKVWNLLGPHENLVLMTKDAHVKFRPGNAKFRTGRLQV